MSGSSTCECSSQEHASCACSARHVRVCVQELVAIRSWAPARARARTCCRTVASSMPPPYTRHRLADVSLLLYVSSSGCSTGTGSGSAGVSTGGSRASATGFLVPPALAPLPPLPDSYVVRLTLARGSAILEKVVCSFQGPDAATPKASERQSPNSTSKVDRGDVGVTCNGSTSSYCMYEKRRCRRSLAEIGQGREKLVACRKWRGLRSAAVK